MGLEVMLVCAHKELLESPRDFILENKPLQYTPPLVYFWSENILQKYSGLFTVITAYLLLV